MIQGPRTPKPYWNPYIAGVALGLVLFLSYFFSSFGLGASGGIARVTTGAVDLVASDFVNRKPFLSHLAGGPANPLNHRMIWMVMGVLVGGFTAGWLGGRLKRTTEKGPNISVHSRWVFALLGGMLMGWGAEMARGCTSGQALSGGGVLSLGSWAFMIMVFAGGYVIAYPLRRLWL